MSYQLVVLILLTSGSECTEGTGASLNVSNKTDEECSLPLRYKFAPYSKW